MSNLAYDLSVYKLNWRPELHDENIPLHIPEGFKGIIAPQWDLEPKSPPCYDQLALGSCTANSTTGAFEIKERIEGRDPGPASRRAVYYFSRALQGTINEDSGSSISTSMKAILMYGLPSEKLCPYDISQYTVHPSAAAMADGAKHRPTTAMIVRVSQDLDHLKAMVSSNSAISFGFTVYASFMTHQVANSGIMPMPHRGEAVEGGHAVAIIGYDSARKMFKIRNSWGLGWGIRGYFWMPEEFMVSKNCSDFMAVIEAPK